MNREKGFTLIELMVVVFIIGIILQMATAAYNTYKTTANYSVISQGMSDAKKSIAARISSSGAPSEGVEYSQTGGGKLLNGAARDLMPAFMLSSQVKMDLSYDPTCESAGCEKTSVQLRHCKGVSYITWMQLGDGTEVTQEKIPGKGCDNG